MQVNWEFFLNVIHSNFSPQKIWQNLTWSQLLIFSTIIFRDSKFLEKGFILTKWVIFPLLLLLRTVCSQKIASSRPRRNFSVRERPSRLPWRFHSTPFLRSSYQDTWNSQSCNTSDLPFPHHSEQIRHRLWSTRCKSFPPESKQQGQGAQRVQRFPPTSWRTRGIWRTKSHLWHQKVDFRKNLNSLKQ